MGCWTQSSTIRWKSRRRKAVHWLNERAQERGVTEQLPRLSSTNDASRNFHCLYWYHKSTSRWDVDFRSTQCGPPKLDEWIQPINQSTKIGYCDKRLVDNFPRPSMRNRIWLSPSEYIRIKGCTLTEFESTSCCMTNGMGVVTWKLRQPSSTEGLWSQIYSNQASAITSVSRIQRRLIRPAFLPSPTWLRWVQNQRIGRQIINITDDNLWFLTVCHNIIAQKPPVFSFHLVEDEKCSLDYL